MKNKILNVLFAAIIAFSLNSCCTDCGYDNQQCEVRDTGILGVVNHLEVPIEVRVYWNSCVPSTLETTDNLYMGIGRFTTFYEETPICSGVMEIKVQGYTIENGLKSVYTEQCSDAVYQVYPRNDSVAFISSGSHTFNPRNIRYN